MWPPVSALHSGQMIVVEGDVACLDGVTVGAQEFGQGESGAFGLEVVQGDVDGGEGLGGHARAAHRGAGPEELGVELADVVGASPMMPSATSLAKLWWCPWVWEGLAVAFTTVRNAYLRPCPTPTLERSSSRKTRYLGVSSEGTRECC